MAVDWLTWQPACSVWPNTFGNEKTTVALEPVYQFDSFTMAAKTAKKTQGGKNVTKEHSRVVGKDEHKLKCSLWKHVSEVTPQLPVIFDQGIPLEMLLHALAYWNFILLPEMKFEKLLSITRWREGKGNMEGGKRGERERAKNTPSYII